MLSSDSKIILLVGIIVVLVTIIIYGMYSKSMTIKLKIDKVGTMKKVCHLRIII